ncbi:hypothetical protein BGW42_007678, partial [Actinomortierella wolfii]
MCILFTSAQGDEEEVVDPDEGDEGIAPTAAEGEVLTAASCRYPYSMDALDVNAGTVPRARVVADVVAADTAIDAGPAGAGGASMV